MNFARPGGIGHPRGGQVLVMRFHKISGSGPEVAVCVAEVGDEAVAELTRLADEQGVGAAGVTGVGGFSRATLGYFDVDAKSYVEIPVDEQVEVLSLTGDITCKGDEHQVHLHVVCGRRDGSTVGGHLMNAVVRPTLELVVTKTPAELQRRHDESSGLALIEL